MPPSAFTDEGAGGILESFSVVTSIRVKDSISQVGREAMLANVQAKKKPCLGKVFLIWCPRETRVRHINRVL